MLEITSKFRFLSEHKSYCIFESSILFLSGLKIINTGSEKDVIFLLRVVVFMTTRPIIADSVSKNLACTIKSTASDGLFHGF